MGENEEENFIGPGQIIIGCICVLNEIIDYIGTLLNVTGFWAIVVLILNILTLFFVLGYEILKGGFSLKKIFGTWWQVALLIAEFIPGLGDLVPGWIGFFIGVNLKKKKATKTVETTAKTVKETI